MRYPRAVPRLMTFRHRLLFLWLFVTPASLPAAGPDGDAFFDAKVRPVLAEHCGSCHGQDRVHVHDLHATLLHLLGFDHERLTYRYAGREILA